MTTDNTFLNQDVPAQKKEILDWLKSGKSLTQLDAMKKLTNKTTRLGARIFDLRKDGHDITTEHVEIKSPGGRAKRIARYWLQKPPELFDK